MTTDKRLKVELVATGINFPTHMAFLSNDDILVLEKNDGTVKRVTKESFRIRPYLTSPSLMVSSGGC